MLKVLYGQEEETDETTKVDVVLSSDTMSVPGVELLGNTDPYLKRVAEPFDFLSPPYDPKELFEAMKTLMIENRGIGLAAPQVGINLRMFIIGDPENPDTIIPVFNPKIIDDTMGENVLYEEGCLSFPDLFVKIKRPSTIKVRYTTHEGVTDTIKFSGFTARIFQHEFDHLNGILFTSRANSFNLERAKKNVKLIRRRRKRAKNEKDKA